MTDAVTVALIASIPPTLVSVVGFVAIMINRSQTKKAVALAAVAAEQSRKNGEAIGVVHGQINSELERWMKAVIAEALTRGRAEGILQERERTEEERRNNS